MRITYIIDSLRSGGKERQLFYLFLEKENLGSYYNLCKRDERDKLLLPEIKLKRSCYGEAFKIDLLKNDSNLDFITNLCKLDLQTCMVDYIHTKVQRVSMQNSLEVRVPPPR